MRTIKAHMANGDYIVTRINGTEEEILQHYIGKPHIYEDVETGKETERTEFVSVDFLD